MLQEHVQLQLWLKMTILKNFLGTLAIGLRIQRSDMDFSRDSVYQRLLKLLHFSLCYATDASSGIPDSASVIVSEAGILRRL